MAHEAQNIRHVPCKSVVSFLVHGVDLSLRLFLFSLFSQNLAPIRVWWTSCSTSITTLYCTVRAVGDFLLSNIAWFGWQQRFGGLKPMASSKSMNIKPWTIKWKTNHTYIRWCRSKTLRKLTSVAPQLLSFTWENLHKKIYMTVNQILKNDVIWSNDHSFLCFFSNRFNY